MKAKKEPTAVVEEYLEAMYKMADERAPVMVARVAERMGVAPATVIGMLKRMTRDELVQVSETKGIALTARGKELAEATLRRHRLAERLLTDIIGVDWHLAHQEACRFEHAISPSVEQKLSKALGNPGTCPHGYPIPGYGGAAGSIKAKPLSALSEGEKAVVDRVPEEDPKLLEYFEQNGLKPGASISVVEIAPFKGTTTLRVGRHNVTVGMAIATTIWVLPHSN